MPLVFCCSWNDRTSLTVSCQQTSNCCLGILLICYDDCYVHSAEISSHLLWWLLCAFCWNFLVSPALTLIFWGLPFIIVDYLSSKVSFRCSCHSCLDWEWLWPLGIFLGGYRVDNVNSIAQWMDLPWILHQIRVCGTKTMWIFLLLRELRPHQEGLRGNGTVVKKGKSTGNTILCWCHLMVGVFLTLNRTVLIGQLVGWNLMALGSRQMMIVKRMTVLLCWFHAMVDCIRI